MANWNKLNAEFDNLINNFSDADWEKWEKQRDQKKADRLKSLLEKAKLQEEKIAYIQTEYTVSLKQLGIEEAGHRCYCPPPEALLNTICAIPKGSENLQSLYFFV